ncbi:hypothetical protein ACYF6T_43520 [Streptomyces sp. 7R007]
MSKVRIDDFAPQRVGMPGFNVAQRETGRQDADEGGAMGGGPCKPEIIDMNTSRKRA